jgi:hypothetical protein
VERIKHYTLRLLTAFSAFVLLLSLIALIVLNSGMLDRLVKDRAISLFNEKFFGRLELKELHLKFPNKVTLINPRIYGPGETLPALEARSVSLKFNFLTLLQPEIKRLYLRRIEADSLNARIIEQKNGKLNLELVFASRDPDSTKAPLEHFFSKKLLVHNSTISYSGNNTHPQSLQLALKNINLELSSFTAKKKYLKGELDKLQFDIPRNNFSLRQASGNFLFSEYRSEILAFKAKGNKSTAELSATVDRFNIFSPHRQTQLSQGRSFVNIEELALHSDDLKLFYPSLVLPDGIYTLKGNAKGKKDNLEILDALITHLKSRVALKGELLNLQKSNAFGFRMVCDSSKIAGSFLESILQNSSYREMAHNAGDITFFGKAKGNLKAVQTDLTILSAPGAVTLSAEATKEGADQFSGKGTFALKSFKPQKLMGVGGEKSLFNASGSFEGKLINKGVNQLALDMKIADSFWQNQPLKEGSLLLNYSNSMMTATVFLKNNLTTFNLDTGIDWKDKTPRYRASGKTAALDLSKVIGSDHFKTDLNGSFDLNGSGFDPKMLNISSSIQFSPSTINGFQLKDHSKASIDIAQNAGSSKVNISSDFLDILAEGDYTLEELIALGKLTGSGISREVASQNIWQASLPKSETGTGKLKDPFTVNYRITVKDISPLVLLFPVENLALQGSADGHAQYRNGQCTVVSAIKLARLRVRNDFLLENLAMDAELECSGIGTQRASATAKASAMTVYGKRTGEALFAGRYTPSRLDGALNLAIPDPAQNISAKFSATRSGNSYDLTVNSLSMKDAEGIWQTPDVSHIMLGRTSARFNRFTLSKGTQLVVLDGELSNLQPGSFQCVLSNVQLKELKKFALDPSLDRLGGTINATLTVSGNPGAKTSTLKLNGKEIRYDKILIGTLQSTTRHSGNLLNFEIHSSIPVSEHLADRTAAMNTIEGSGTIPLVIGYYPFQIHTVDHQAVDASFHSDNLSAQFLEYLLPFFESAEGIIPTTLRITGRTPNPDIYLTSRLHDTKIKIEPTQVSYLLNGEVYVTPKAIELRNISIHDNLNGTGTINGMVKLEKMEPGELALGGRFDSLLLFNKKDRKDETSFGTITGTTNNLLLHGTLSAPLVEGELRVNAADFSLYRSGANESAKYIGVNKFIEFVPRYPSKSTQNTDINMVPAEPAEFNYSLLDILQIKNLKLSSVEPLKYTVIFDRIRGEQLETSINNLTLIVNKSNQQYRLFGSVNVNGGKYKFSNSNFDLQDGGKITWNNADIRGGVMDNLYGIKYVSATNQQTGERDNVKLLLAITGTLNEPQVGMGYYLNEQSQPFASVNMIGGQSSQIDPNAELNVISMLLSKQWYIRPGSSSQSSNIASSVGISAGTGMISSQISRVVQNIAGLESFNVNVGVDKHGALSGLDLYFALNVPGTDGKVRFIGTGSAPTIKQSVVSDYYGTAQKIEYRVTPKVYLEAYRSYGQSGNENSSINLQKPSETWGASISYRERFNTWDQFWKRITHSSGNKK